MRRFQPTLRTAFAVAAFVTIACMPPSTRTNETIQPVNEIHRVASDSSDTSRADTASRHNPVAVNATADTVRHRKRESKPLGEVALATEVTALALIAIAVFSWARILIP